jgi:membrane-bound lytic murein transglycosylase D
MSFWAKIYRLLPLSAIMFSFLIFCGAGSGSSSLFSQTRQFSKTDTCCNENDSTFKTIIEPTIEKSRQKYLRGLILIDRNDKENATKYFEESLKSLNILADFQGIEKYEDFIELVKSILTDYNNYIKKIDKLDNKSIVALYKNKYLPEVNQLADKQVITGETPAQKEITNRPPPRKDTVIAQKTNAEVLNSIIKRYNEDSAKAVRQKEPMPNNPLISQRDTLRLAVRDSSRIMADTVPQLSLQEKFQNVPLPDNEFVQKSIDFLTKDRGRRWIISWLERGGKWFTMFKKIAKDEGLPEPIIYSSIIESGLKPDIVSPAKAVGMWQFMLGTGKMYGLNNPNSVWLDERRDFEKSTVAAMKHYKDLFYEFEDWALAVAAYNCGVGCVKRAIKRSGLENPTFWDIREFLPKETRNHVPLFIAVAKIVMDPAKYEFSDNEINPEQEISFDIVKINEPVSIKAIAFCANTSIEHIQELNPEILKGYTPIDIPEYKLRLPAGSLDLFTRNFAKLGAEDKKPWIVYKSEKDDTPKSIAEMFGITAAELYSVNNLNGNTKLKPGTQVIVPTDRHIIDETDDIVDQDFSKSKQNISYVTHIVNSGETVYSISQKYTVRMTDLRNLNSLSYEDDKLPSGTKLKIPVSNDPSSKRYHFEKLENPRIVKHIVEKGENIEKVADFYDVYPEEIINVNNLKSGSLSEGQVIKVVTRNSRKNYNTYPTFYASSDNKYSDLSTLTTDLTLTTREGKTLIIHRVGENESLLTISQKFEANQADIKNWNKSKIKGDKVYPGTNLKIYKN